MIGLGSISGLAATTSIGESGSTTNTIEFFSSSVGESGAGPASALGLFVFFWEGESNTWQCLFLLVFTVS